MAYSKDEIALASKFRSDSWGGLPISEKRQAVKELLEYSAKINGHNPPEVTFDDIEGYTAGYQIDGKIVLNANFVDHGIMITRDSNGEIAEIKRVENAGSEVMCTCFHEDIHVHQGAVAKNEVDLSEYDTQYVRDMVAGGKISTYFDPEFNYMLYRIQPNENEAFTKSVDRTMDMLKATEPYYGPESSIQNLETQKQKQQQYVEEAKELFADRDFDKALAAGIRDKFYGTNEASAYQSGQIVKSFLERSERYNLLQAQRNTHTVSEENTTAESTTTKTTEEEKTEKISFDDSVHAVSDKESGHTEENSGFWKDMDSDREYTQKNTKNLIYER